MNRIRKAVVASLIACSISAAPALARTTRYTMGLLAALMLFAAFRYQIYTAEPEMVVSSLTFKLQKNVADSVQLRHDIDR